MAIKKRLHIPRKFLCFVRKVALASVMIFAVLLSNGGYMILSTLHLDTLADAVGVQEARAAASGDGKIFYSIAANTTPQTRDYISASNSFNSIVSTGQAGGVALQSVLRASPTQDEFVAGYLDNAGTLRVMCYNGASWTNEWSVSVGGTGTTRRFDIAYETTSGDVMVAYSTNAASTNEIAYRTKPGSTACGAGNWAGVVNYDAVRTAGVVSWLRLEASPVAGSNTIAMAWNDAASDLSAAQWTGSSWAIAEPAAALETALEYGSAAQDTQSFDIAIENTTGYLMVAWGVLTTTVACTAGTNCMRYARYTTSWQAVAQMATIADSATSIDLAADPATGSNKILLGAIDNGTVTANALDLSRGVWSGSAWTNIANADSSTGALGAGLKTVSVGWLNNGATNRGVLVYYDSAATNVGWQTVSGTTWTAQTDWVGAPAFGVQKQYDIQVDPINKNNLIFTVSDANSDVFAKRLTMDGAAAFTWTNADGSAAIEGTTGSATYKTFSFAYNRYIPNTLTIGMTAGSMATAINSGDTDQYANDTACASAAACSAFTLNVSNTTVTITSIKITETGTVSDGDLTNAALFYDTDGNYSNGVTGQYGSTVGTFTSGTATVSGSLALTPGTTYYFYVRYDAINGSSAPKGGQTIDFSIAAPADVAFTGSATGSGAPVLAGATTFVPNATATTYGASLADGGRSNESMTISGYGFGVAPGGSRANCGGAVDTGCVRFVAGGNATVADGDVTAWSNTSITYAIDPGLATFGGTDAVEVVAGGQSDASKLTFLIYPNVSGMAACTDCGTNAAREYAAADTDGLVMIQGDHLGSAVGTVTFGGGFGSLAGAIHAAAEGPCTTGDWSASGYSGNTVCVEVNPSISNSVYTGTVTVTRDSDAKTDYIDLRVLPRIVSNSPTSDVKGATVQILGNHLCESGTCPTAGNRSTVSDSVLFGATQAPDGDFLALSGGAGACNGTGAAWTHTEICVKVPAAADIGSQPTKATSNNSYTSNTEAFTILSSIPNDPTNLLQYQADGVTPLAIGGFVTVGDMVHAADIAASLTIDMALQIESKLVGSAFVCGAGDCGDAEEGTVGEGGACASCTVLNNAQLSHPHPDGSYHWQARVRNTTTNEYSNWVSFGGNAESAADYVRDASAPAITSGPNATPDTNAASITWGTSGEQSTSQVQHNLTGTFVNDCATNNDCTALDMTYVFNHTVALGNLDSNTTYYYRVRSKDTAGNETIGSTLNFATGGVTQPGKTTTFHIIGRTTSISGGGSASPTFTVSLPESSPTVKSAFVEMTGISGTTGTNTVGMQVNGQAIGSYVIDAAAKTQFKILYSVDPANLTVNDDPTVNTLTISPSLDTYISSAKIVVTYAYTP